MNAYIYQGEMYCEDCAREVCKCLDNSNNHPVIDVSDPESYDSDVYPKSVCQIGESDQPEHCACGKDCINAIELSNKRKIGKWLGNSLTPEGIAYVKKVINKFSPVTRLWKKLYQECLSNN